MDPVNHGLDESIMNGLIVPEVGIEPTLREEHDFESCASANSATRAYENSSVIKSVFIDEIKKSP